MLRGQLAAAPDEELRQREATFLRYAGHGLFVTLQNPFGQWKRQGEPVLAGLPARHDVASRARMRLFRTGSAWVFTRRRESLSPPRMTPEWKLVPAGSSAAGPRIDVAEVDTAVECSRAFLTYHPTVPERVMVGWCVNDYQIDIAKPEGRAEYKRIIDQVAAIGGKRILFDPANSIDAPMDQNRDAWGWENLLWFTMGQKLRKGEWDPAKDKLPASVQEMVDYAQAKDIKFLAYVYPSLPFLQQKEWTSWVPNGQPGGYLGADTGQRSFQDWLIGKLVDFHTEAPGQADSLSIIGGSPTTKPPAAGTLSGPVAAASCRNCAARSPKWSWTAASSITASACGPGWRAVIRTRW